MEDLLLLEIGDINFLKAARSSNEFESTVNKFMIDAQFCVRV